MKHSIFTQQEIEHIKQIRIKNNIFTAKKYLTQVTKGLVVSAVLVLAIEVVKATL